MSRRLYPLFLALSPLAYVGYIAVRASGGSVVSMSAVAATVALVLWVIRFTQASTVGDDLVGEGPRAAARVVTVGCSTLIIARTGPDGRASLDAAAAFGVGLAALATLYGLARVPRNPGLLEPGPENRRLDGVAVMMLVALIATTVPAAAAIVPTVGARIDPLMIDYALGAESLAALGLLTLASLRFHRGRRLDLVAASRASAALTLSMTALFGAVPAAWLGFSPPDRVLPYSAAAAAFAVTTTLVVPDARVVGRALRTLLVVSVLGTPLALATAGAAQAAPTKAGGIVLGASAALVLVGVLGRRIAFLLRRDTARWERALHAAQDSATVPEPHAALRATLSSLRDGMGPTAPSPIVYRFGLDLATTVDLAGYLRDERATPPEDASVLAREEPFHVLRLEVVRALEVRQPVVRTTLAWMEAHDHAAVVTLDDEDGPVGLLALPRAGRRAPLTLEEAIALGRLADRLAAVLSLAGALEGARRRELHAEERLAESEATRERHEDERRHERERGLRLVTRLAHTAPLARYSAAARLAEGELMKASASGRPVVLLVPPGVLADAHVAEIHVSSQSSRGPLVVADGTEPRDRAEAAWEGPSSPIALASGGTLAVFDVPCLPLEAQEKLARASIDGGVRLIFTVRETVDVLVAKGRLSPTLADEVGDRAIPIPPLAARSDDLRAMALDQLARIGFALAGAPLGLGDDALAILQEHVFTGNDTELRSVLLEAALRSSGGVVRAKDLPL